MELKRQAKYLYLRLIRLKDDPKELALGMAIGIFVGMLPIVPFQIAVAVTLALFFKASKITATLGTWISNPLNLYFIYWWDYKLGCIVLKLYEKNSTIYSILDAIKTQDPIMVAIKVLESGTMILSAFIVGGIITGLVVAIPSYPLFIFVFHKVHIWREQRRQKKKSLKKAGNG